MMDPIEKTNSEIDDIITLLLKYKKEVNKIVHDQNAQEIHYYVKAHFMHGVNHIHNITKNVINHVIKL